MAELLNAFPQYPDCMFCIDKGVTFDEFNGYRFCTRAAGFSAAQLGPAIVDEANEARKRVLAG